MQLRAFVPEFANNDFLHLLVFFVETELEDQPKNLLSHTIRQIDMAYLFVLVNICKVSKVLGLNFDHLLLLDCTDSFINNTIVTS
jgi:hypothetical protein